MASGINRTSPVISPLTGGEAVTLIKQFPVSFLVDGYKRNYQIDIERFFDDMCEISLFECTDSGLRFFWPDTMAGDGAFYAELQMFPWYYMSDKWEHQITVNRLTSGMNVLEIGSGGGAFIDECVRYEVAATGLELNQVAAENCRKRGLDVRSESLEDHARRFRSSYDVVCSFQVMEHVTDVRSVLTSSIELLKPGGLLVISVPNNDSFISWSEDNYLNFPPHHMLRWNEASLKFLATEFGLKIEEILYEPLQKYHVKFYWTSKVKRIFPVNIMNKLMRFLIVKSGIYRVLQLFNGYVKGHSIMIIYSKPMS